MAIKYTFEAGLSAGVNLPFDAIQAKVSGGLTARIMVGEVALGRSDWSKR